MWLIVLSWHSLKKRRKDLVMMSLLQSVLQLMLLVSAAVCIPVNHPMENPNLFEGDMILSPDQMKSIMTGDMNKGIPLAATKLALWPRVVPFDYHELKWHGNGRYAIDSAIKEFEKHTCLRFKERSTEPGYLQFVDKGGCFTYVGYSMGPNQISLGKGCWVPAIAMHEMMHALGFYHEQSRPDRDQYVKIHYENMHKDSYSQFKKRSYTEIDSLGSPYDYLSVMHYRGKAFSNNNQVTIETLDKSMQDIIGQSSGLSKSDIEQLNKLYKCHENPTTAPPLPQTTFDPSCTDTYSRCYSHKDKCSLPKDNVWFKWVSKECRKTCGLCTEVPKDDEVSNDNDVQIDNGCADVATNCNQLKSSCSLPSWKDLMARQCAFTCGLCAGRPKTTVGPDCYDTADCASYVVRGYCSPKATLHFHNFMKKNCIKSCGWCGDLATPLPGTSPPWPQECGISSIPMSKVVGGKEAKPGAWPWQARLFKTNTTISFCGASLISTTWLVTATHCVKGKQPEDITVYLGVHHLGKKDQHWQAIGVRRIIEHPHYRRLNNDIALLQLEKPAILNDRVKTVCIPKQSASPAVGTTCYITGWGKTKHPGNGAITLQQTDLPIVANSDCHAVNYPLERISVTQAMLCAGHGSKSIKGGCHGDSGGPLVCEENGRFVLHGDVSWGSNTCDATKGYTVFGRVAYFRQWMDQYIYT